MRKLNGTAALILILMTGGCGGEPPNNAAPTGAAPADPAPGNPQELETLEQHRQNAPRDAVDGFEAYVAKYPTDPKGHWGLARALEGAVPLLASEYSDADRAALERAAQHRRKVLELSSDGALREAALMGLMETYGPLRLARPGEVIGPAKELIAMSATLGSPHTKLSGALADLKRPDDAVHVWSEAAKTLRGRDRREIAAGIGYLTELHPELSEAHVQTLVAVLTTVAEDVEYPDPRAKALALKLRAQRLEKDAATKKALLQEAAPWDALADQQGQKSIDELKAAIADLQRRSAAGRR